MDEFAMAFQPPSPETILRARQAYLEGQSPRAICKDHDLTLHTLYVWLDGGPAGAKPRLPPIPRRRDGAQRMPKRLSGNRTAIVKRLWQTAERQVRDIENRLVLAQQEPVERERDARMMAVLVKTLCDLSALDGAKVSRPATRGAAKSTSAGPEHHDAGTDAGADDGPRDIEEFRRELARRIAALAGDEASGIGGELQSQRSEPLR
jgi:hypothetical protein